MTVDDPVGNKDHEEEDEASEISVKVTKIFLTRINSHKHLHTHNHILSCLNLYSHTHTCIHTLLILPLILVLKLTLVLIFTLILTVILTLVLTLTLTLIFFLIIYSIFQSDLKNQRSSDVRPAVAGYNYDPIDVKIARKKLLVRRLRSIIINTGKRSDGRGVEDVRPITIDTSLLPGAHGSSLFTRGETQSLSTATLGK